MRSSHFCVGAEKMFDLAVEKYGVPYPSQKIFMSRKKVPYLDLGIDCYDKREFNTQRVRKDVDLFLSTIIK